MFIHRYYTPHPELAYVISMVIDSIFSVYYLCYGSYVLPHMRISAHTRQYGTAHTRMGYPVRVWANRMPQMRMGQYDAPYVYGRPIYEYMDNCVLASML